MRDDATAERIRSLLAELGRYSHAGDRVYLTGGATAVLVGWRQSTLDVDIRLEGNEDVLLRAIAELKDRLSIKAAFEQMRSDLFRFPAVEDRLARAVASLPTAPPAESVPDA